MTTQKGIIIDLKGQSNCSGEALYSELDNKYKGKLNAKIFNNLNSKWEYLEANVNSFNSEARFYTLNSLTVGSWNNKHGIELALMTNLSEYYKTTCYLYKYGWSGSALQTVSSGGTWNPLTSGNGALYENSNNFSNISLPSSKLIKPKPNVIIWIQGESDNPNYSNYANALNFFITKEREYYNDQNIPFIVVGLSNLQTVIPTINLQGIKTAQKAVSSKLWNNGVVIENSGIFVLPNVHYVEQNNATRDNLHYTESGYINIANTISEIIIKLNII